MIAALKFVHIVGLALWCAALIGLPLLIWANRKTVNQSDYAQFRMVTHVGYIAIATPAALVAIIAGTGLIFAAQIFQPWFLAKLAFVAALVVVHAWLGHLIQKSGEERRTHWSGAPILALVLILPLIAVILGLVLTKPDLSVIQYLVPDQFLSPRASAS